MPAVVPTLLIFPIKLPPSPQYAAAAPQEMMQHLLMSSHNGQNKNPAQGGNCSNERPQNVVYRVLAQTTVVGHWLLATYGRRNRHLAPTRDNKDTHIDNKQALYTTRL